MICPASQISKFLLTLLIIILLFYFYMDFNLYLRLQNYPLDNDNSSAITYEKVTWLSCRINPLCEVTVKGVLLDHTNYYVFGPLVQIIDNILRISDIKWITPNSISFFHIFVAILSAKCVTSHSLTYRRIGVLLFEIRTWLDDLDGHVARVRKHIKGERSEIGTAGYYIDGICDAVGCTALIIGVFVFLRNNPPRRGYILLSTTSDSKEPNILHSFKVTVKKVAKTVCCFSLQLIISSTAWNRYIALYQDLLENYDLPGVDKVKQCDVFKNSFFFFVAWLWRVINIHNLLHLLLLSIFCDKLWEFLRNTQYVGYGVLISVVCITEINIIDIKNFIFYSLNETEIV
ncbi:ceramide phosphoethanolamine synthase [Diorhabda sublineata]|uniref:ceramide phosphoethanolamine synthase n=1 Tax=Diorhabda sublineata TaxID=1163346 RepID=UPI0024E1356F|nr:ceramide phosphoethanolamine synthase [Diorhabda sublineata]XP_056630608.1 ceramide phosphoethanolamine synthase [Diorhabda sublineata]